LRSHAKHAKNPSRDQFAESHIVTNEQQLSLRKGMVSRETQE